MYHDSQGERRPRSEHYTATGLVGRYTGKDNLDDVREVHRAYRTCNNTQHVCFTNFRNILNNRFHSNLARSARLAERQKYSFRKIRTRDTRRGAGEQAQAGAGNNHYSSRL